ncbi:chitin disaccharide deacetylase [Bacillus pseudomycoides]|uniref:chitin disaccharide deacetylase n=1 Tax=Bacillus pseudomycoides TaxID=64104 RepID=UPI000BEE196D|nr:chitin disaccharide deacetylase [Bacillus pseudomycoides]PEB40853.1 chitin disaccharide deacetylase [Bacillus pseudomycoides]PGD99069.1 chitin disaccharide deacetylase [Bacillus pseudomycoides]PGE06158.1 chitin disaccharide deacetylase [Bacillus pseudomycoides]PHE68605.1 chitin disaccharide deacetylase [Bacillus pseudomycoides]PHG23261.1 chitin disaccharide deacetylase [Bacillus pseudomycoides]
MIRLIVNADDFGLTEGTNYGIIEGHVNGIVNSTTMMMNMPGTEHAVCLAKEYKTLGVGVHLALTAGKPLLTDVPSLVGEDGLFHKQSVVREGNINPEEVEREWMAQIEKFLSYGLKPTHLDSHHHVHALPILHDVLERLAEKYNVPIRRCAQGRAVRPFSDVFYSDFYSDGVQEDYFVKLKGRVQDGKTVEVMVHPAYIDPELVKRSSYVMDRVKELRILMESVLPEGIELVRF